MQPIIPEIQVKKRSTILLISENPILSSLTIKNITNNEIKELDADWQHDVPYYHRFNINKDFINVQFMKFNSILQSKFLMFFN